MRKDRLSSFQAKKQKLLKIKKEIENCKDENWKEGITVYEVENNMVTTKYTMLDRAFKLINKIWELVKDEQ